MKRHVRVIVVTGVNTTRTNKSHRGNLGVARCGCEMLMSSTQNVWESGLTLARRRAMVIAALSYC